MTYDCFTYNGEEDILELRFNILDPYVDYFVLYEAHKTFSGKEKPLYYKENAMRFDKWAHKIKWIEGFPADQPNAFAMAFRQKEGLKEGLKNAKDNDIIYFGDVDEIWKPQDIKDDKVHSLEQLNYCYYLNNRSSERWIGTIVGRWKNITEDLTHYRQLRANILENGGWHFTNMGGPEQIKKKLESYDHEEMNTRENQVLINERMKDGEDYVGRIYDWEGKPFVFLTSEIDLPEYILYNKEKYKHLWK